MAGTRRRGKKRSPAKDNEANQPSVSAHGDSKTDEGETTKPDSIVMQSRIVKRKKTQQANRPSAIVGPLKWKPQDAFQRLSSIEVGVIIEFLPVESTHTLRLVSKFWKASSEYHNAALAIRKHFPDSGLAKRTYATREEANLQFRRLLYQQQSLEKGLATRAIRLRSVDFWHLNGNTLLWASRSGNISVGNLRPVPSAPSTQGKDFVLKLSAHLKHRPALYGASLLNNGDLLVHISTKLDSEGPSEARADSYDAVKVIRMSREGIVLWEVPHEIRDWLGKLAVGATSFYYFYRSLSLRKEYFCKRSLDDGSVVFQRQFSFSHDYPDYDLELFGSEKWAAVWVGPKSIGLLKTTSGSLVSVLPSDVWPVFDRTEARYWDTCAGSLKPCHKVTYDVNEEYWVREDLSLQLDVTEAFSIAANPHLQLCFRIKRDHFPPVLRLSVAPLTVQDAVQDDGTRVPGLTQSSGFAMVTLPTSSARYSLTRRNLNFRLSAAMSWGTGSMGMTGDYIILPDTAGRELLVLDFWPHW